LHNAGDIYRSSGDHGSCDVRPKNVSKDTGIAPQAGVPEAGARSLGPESCAGGLKVSIIDCDQHGLIIIGQSRQRPTKRNNEISRTHRWPKIYLRNKLKLPLIGRELADDVFRRHRAAGLRSAGR